MEPHNTRGSLIAAHPLTPSSLLLSLRSCAGVSERIALCITRAYPTFRRLWDAYSHCSTDKQREMLLQVGETSCA